MASVKVANDGKGECSFFVISQKFNIEHVAPLTSEEADLILDWTVKCQSEEGQKLALRIFELCGGSVALKKSAGAFH